MPLGIVGTSFPFCVSARLLGRQQHKRSYGPGTLPDRGSLGIESETTQTGIDWAPAGSALLTRGSFEGGANPTNSGLFRRVRACWKRRIACKLPHEEHQFSAIISETRFSHWRRSDASMITRRGPRRLEIPTTAGSMTREAALLLFSSVRANVSTIYRISFACTQGRIETE